MTDAPASKSPARLYTADRPRLAAGISSVFNAAVRAASTLRSSDESDVGSQTRRDSNFEAAELQTLARVFDSMPLALETFEAWDTKRTGSLTREQFTRGIAMYSIEPDEASELFERIDFNGDGVIMLNELLRAAAKVQRWHREQLAKVAASPKLSRLLTKSYLHKRAQGPSTLRDLMKRSVWEQAVEALSPWAEFLHPSYL